MPCSSQVRLAELALLRRAGYWLFGASLLYPTEERRAAVAGAATELARRDKPLEKLACYPEWRQFLAAIRRTVDSGNADLEESYVELFLVSEKIPLCESGLVSPGAPAMTMAMLEQEYGAAGLSVLPSFKEPPDHAAVELEFMSLLCGEEAKAWMSRSAKDSVARIEKEAGFLDRHLSRWFPQLAQIVGWRAADTFYASLTRAAHAFIEHDRGLLPALLAEYRREGLHG